MGNVTDDPMRDDSGRAESPAALGGGVGTIPIVDAHVHVWDPSHLRYPWLSQIPLLARPFLRSEYAAATTGIAIERTMFVEANCLPEQTLDEVELFGRIAGSTPEAPGIVAFASLDEPNSLYRALDQLSANPLVKGIRHNIQGEPRGFCLQPSFVAGVREVGRRGWTFDICATHDQLEDVLELVRACPNTRFVLDHCGKPAIRDRLLDPWRANISAIAEVETVACKLSGLVTEARREWRADDLVPYADHVAEAFGVARLIYGSDWPVLTLAATYQDWFAFTEQFTSGWSADDRRAFYGANALRVYWGQSRISSFQPTDDQASAAALKHPDRAMKR